MSTRNDHNVVEEEQYSSPDEINSGLQIDVNGWSWVRQHLQGTRVLINQYVQFSILDDITNVLQNMDIDCYDVFHNSCFGKFLLVNGENYSLNSCIHQLLTHQVTIPAADPTERWFKIGARFIRFSKYEFALVMGLCFGNMEYDKKLTYADLSPNGVYRRNFNGRKNGICPSDLRGLFIDEKFYDLPHDAICIAKILFVVYLLAGRDLAKCPIPHWIWHLIDDMDRWENFPWGSYAYSMLLEGIDKIVITKPITPNYRYHFYGCTVALLIWSYEAIPSMGQLFAKKIKDDVDLLLPRICHWNFKKIVKTETLRVSDLFQCHQSQLICHKYLQPRDHEVNQLYWLSVLQWSPKGHHDQNEDYSTEPEGHHVDPQVHHGDSPSRRDSRSPPTFGRARTSPVFSGAQQMGVNTDEPDQPSSDTSQYLTREEAKEMETRIINEVRAAKNELMDAILESDRRYMNAIHTMQYWLYDNIPEAVYNKVAHAMTGRPHGAPASSFPGIRPQSPAPPTPYGPQSSCPSTSNYDQTVQATEFPRERHQKPSQHANCLHFKYNLPCPTARPDN